jgi:hypothetical protein
MRLVVAGEQPCHRERVVQRVLQVVVDSVAAEVSRKLPGEESLEVTEGGSDPLDVSAGPGLREDLLNRPAYGRNRTDLHGVGYVVVAAPVSHRRILVLGTNAGPPTHSQCERV